MTRKRKSGRLDEVVAEFQPILGDDLFLVEVRADGQWKAPTGQPRTYSLQRALAVAEFIATPSFPSRVVRMKTTSSFTVHLANEPAVKKVAP